MKGKCPFANRPTYHGAREIKIRAIDYLDRWASYIVLIFILGFLSSRMKNKKNESYFDSQFKYLHIIWTEANLRCNQISNEKN